MTTHACHPAFGRLKQWGKGLQVQDHSELHCETATQDKTKKREQRTKTVRQKELARERERGEKERETRPEKLRELHT